MHQFAGQTPDDKIKFLFKVYDIDGKLDFYIIILLDFFQTLDSPFILLYSLHTYIFIHILDSPTFGYILIFDSPIYIF